jgi:autotransporter translocation and assembly factor TamB
MHADTLLVEGILNGNAQLRNVMQQPSFITDLTITDLSVRQDTIGNASIKVNNTIQDTYSADVAITGRGNDVRLTGQYHMAPQNASTYDLNMVIGALQLHSVEGLSMNNISNATGYLSGNVRFNGSLQKPNINGELNFNKTGMLVNFLNSYFTIDQEKLVVNNDGLRFDTFTIKDSVGNSIVIDGIAASSNFTNYQFNINVTARNFRAINSTKKQNALFYGSLYINTNLHIGGTETAPSVDGSLAVNKQTDFTIVLPQEQPGVESREGIVEFIDVDAPISDSVLLKPYYCLNNCNVSGIDMSVNVTIH